MHVSILRKPVILYETVEAIYQKVNGITLEQKKRDMLLKYGQKLTGAQRSRMELLCSQLSKLVDAACRELPETPRLSYYFQRYCSSMAIWSSWSNKSGTGSSGLGGRRLMPPLFTSNKM